MAVTVNNQPLHETDLFLRLGANSATALFAKRADLKRWRIHVPAVSGYTYQGDTFYSLGAIPGLRYHVDQSTQTLYIMASASAFNGTIVDGLIPQNPKAQPTPWGGFFNYDLLGTHVTGNTQVNGLFEVGLFNDWGVGTSSFLDQNIGRSGSHLIRLDTAWRHDDPADMTTLTLGDSITRGGLTGLDVRLGGVQYGTNFETRPYFVTFPMPGLSGSTALPSTVDLYVNGLLKSSQQVPSGPFSVPAVPVVTGPGEATLVVHNALGQARVITTSFYTSSSLLKPGLNDYSFSVGKLRENYGLDSNGYSNFAATGLFRHGFTRHFTGEVHAEFSNVVRDVSLGATFADTRTGAIDMALAVSNSGLGSGVLGRLGLQHQWKSFSLGGDVQLASPRFTELGYNGMPVPRKQISATAGLALGPAGSVYGSYLDQDSPLFGHTRLITAGYSVSVAQVGFFNINAFHALSGTSNNGVSFTFTMPFGTRSNVSTGVSYQNGNTRGYVQVQRSLPVGTGSGYRVSTEVGPDPATQAEYDYQNAVGTYRMGVQNIGGTTGYQAEASGGLAFIGGGVYASRHIDGAFGLVKVPGLAGVTIYDQNQPVATTNRSGDALIPRLHPYQNNPLRLGVKNLPLGAQVTTLKLDAVPRYRSGVVETFPVTNTHGATFTVHLADGKDLPAGATVHIVGHSQTFPVGLNGEVYLTGLSAHNFVEATWDHQTCRFIVAMPQSKDPIPDLGTFKCEGVHL
ncbi:MAG: fimbria/pilus outer membrane usher protein [Gammaproteobacteria bacterium]